MSLIQRYKTRIKLWYLRQFAQRLSVEKEDLLVFGARNGLYYMDNSRALYEWYLHNRPDQKVIWLTHSKEVIAYLKGKNYPVAAINSREGISSLYKAKFGFYTNRALDLAANESFLPAELRLIFLSHGQSVKNSRLTVKKGLSQNFKQDIIKTGSQVYRAITSSAWMAEIQAKSQGFDTDKYLVTGFPRNDWLIDIPQQNRQHWEQFTFGEKYNKVILYAPTWRMHGEPTRLFPFTDLDIASLSRFLEENKILLLLRPHIQELNLDNNKAIVQKLTQATERVRLATNSEFSDANALLPFVDILISDYSSIYHDFLQLDRPMAFIPYDYEFFEAENGFKYPYKEHLPGPVIQTQADLLKELGDLMKGEDAYASQRAMLKKKIYKDEDAHACKRVAAEIDKLL